MSSPALAVLATLRWLAEGRVSFGAAALQTQQEAAAVGAGESTGPDPDGETRRPNPKFCRPKATLNPDDSDPTTERNLSLIGTSSSVSANVHGKQAALGPADMLGCIA